METADVLYDEDVAASKNVACPRLCRAQGGAQRRRLSAGKGGLITHLSDLLTFSAQSSTKAWLAGAL